MVWSIMYLSNKQLGDNEMITIEELRNRKANRRTSNELLGICQSYHLSAVDKFIETGVIEDIDTEKEEYINFLDKIRWSIDENIKFNRLTKLGLSSMQELIEIANC